LSKLHRAERLLADLTRPLYVSPPCLIASTAMRTGIGRRGTPRSSTNVALRRDVSQDKTSSRRSRGEPRRSYS
jgi:hypothetical protein